MPSVLRAAAQTLAPLPVLDFWTRRLNKTWSLQRPLARVIERQEAARDSVTLVLRPNRRFRGFEPGQHVDVTVEIDGRRYTRSYSPRHAVGHRGCVEITVRRTPGGRVSTHLCRAVKPGDVLELGTAYGEMSAPREAPSVLLAAGSGITPMLSMLREHAARGMPQPVTLYYWGRTRAELCFQAELRDLARRFPNFGVHFVLTREAALLDDEREGRIGTLLPRVRAEDRVFACGPAGFVAVARALVGSVSKWFIAESFSPPVPLAGESGTVRVTLAKSGRTLELARGTPLLGALEAQGETPAYGCRMGICNTCACSKRSGITRNVLTGDSEAEPVSALRLCVSAAASDLVIDL